MDIRQALKQQKIYLDGGMGTLLQAQGLPTGELPERWNITHPEQITAIHKAYFDAGSNVVNANTFGANRLKFPEEELEQIIKAAMENARKAKETSVKPGEKWVALDIGPLGRLLKPYGDLDFEDAVSYFADTVKLGVKYGADLIFIETMNDSYETKAAVLAAKENSCLPVMVSNAYGEDGKLMTGARPSAMAAMLEGLGADAIGANCSVGPDRLLPVAKELLECASVPVLIKPNAGLPQSDGQKTWYDVTPEEFARDMRQMAEMGVMILGGCCGTTPEYIRQMVEQTQEVPFRAPQAKKFTVVSSYTHAVRFAKEPILIGERINPTGKKRFREALMQQDMNYVLQEGIRQQEKGVHILDVNVGLPDIDEVSMLVKAVEELQAVVDLPLQIDTANPTAMERALRRYNGKAMVNSVNGKEENMKAIFPLVKKYGGVVVALTLDEGGIPETVEGRVRIAQKIQKTAEEYGIGSENLIFDPLCLTVSADLASAQVTLDTVQYIKESMKCNTSLGVSNISFGLPMRDAVNSVFFAMALEKGLSAAILNPYSVPMLKTYYSFRMLHNLDENCTEYLAFAKECLEAEEGSVKAVSQQVPDTLEYAVEKGLREQAAMKTRSLLETMEPMEVIHTGIIPALNKVGREFETGTVYLPQLLMSADAAKAAFEVIKTAMSGNSGEKKGMKIVLATVKGDIHDIGKNIVKVLLENYGFTVLDLGKDVAPELSAQTVEMHKAPLCGLSALMTTTVPAMEETIQLLHKRCPYCKVIVGGAVLTQEYADRIGADSYAKDAMEAVRYAEKVSEGIFS